MSTLVLPMGQHAITIMERVNNAATLVARTMYVSIPTTDQAFIPE
jgi:hypothetical protein